MNMMMPGWTPVRPMQQSPMMPTRPMGQPMQALSYPVTQQRLPGQSRPNQTWFPGMPVNLARPRFIPVAPVRMAPPQPVWRNDLKALFQNRQAITYALHLRTFAADDKNHNGVIEPRNAENGNFLRAIKELPKLKALGVNNIHLLPILPIGRIDYQGRIGAPGSAYAPSDYTRLNPEYFDPASNLSLVQQARAFVDACHKNGIHVMVDVPSCASVDLANSRPDLMARDAQGNMQTPTNWFDIRMFVKDSPQLREYFGKFFDLMVKGVGVDGFRVDVARARTHAFWRHFIGKYPEKAWLAETYTEEDATPMKNIPRDVPEELLKDGFDSIYGQFHIFHDLNANDYTQYLLQNQAMLNRVGPWKSILGTFLTHDDPSAMDHGGALFYKLASGLMMTQPDTNPYILDGFTTGYRRNFEIFNWDSAPRGKYPEIGDYMQRMITLRKNPAYGPILTHGKFIPLPVDQDRKDPKVIAFLRQYQGRTLLVVANKDVNAAHKANIEIPGLNPRQQLVNLSPNYGEPSTFSVKDGRLQANLERARFYLFEVALPTY